MLQVKPWTRSRAKGKLPAAAVSGLAAARGCAGRWADLCPGTRDVCWLSRCGSRNGQNAKACGHVCYHSSLVPFCSNSCYATEMVHADAGLRKHWAGEAVQAGALREGTWAGAGQGRHRQPGRTLSRWSLQSSRLTMDAAWALSCSSEPNLTVYLQTKKVWVTVTVATARCGPPPA